MPVLCARACMCARTRGRIPKKLVPCEPPEILQDARAHALETTARQHFSCAGCARIVATQIAFPRCALKLSTYIVRDCKRRPVLDQRLHHFWPAMVDSHVQRHLPVRIFHGDLGTVLNEQRNDLGLIGLHRVVDERLMVLREYEVRELVGVRGQGYLKME